MSAPSQFGPPPQQSGGGSTVLVIVLVILGVLLLGCAGLCAGCYVVARRAGQSISKGLEEGIKIALLSPAYADTQEAVATYPAVIVRIGEPIEFNTLPQRQAAGELKPGGETFQFDIKGPKGVGIVSAVATAPDRQSPFHVTKITVTFSDGAVIDIPSPDQPVESSKVESEGVKKDGEQQP